jgi:hypothetical protein
MRRHAPRIGLVLALTAIVAGCAMDVPRMMKTDATLQTQVMGAIGADSALAGRMVDQLLGGAPTRESLVHSVMNNGDAARAVMVMVAQDPSRLDAVLGLAVQDSTMKVHVLTLLKGMQMAGTK